MPNMPNNFTPMILAIEDAFVSGSGTSPWVLTANSMSLGWFYENRTQEGLAQDTLVKPQIKIKINSFEDANAWLQPNMHTMYNVEIGIDMAYHLDSKLLRAKRREIETRVANDAIKIQRTMNYQQNLLSGSGGYTGLVSGMLKFDRYTNPKFDYTNSVATATCIFTGKIVLSASL